MFWILLGLRCLVCLLVRLFVGWYSIVSCGVVLVVWGVWFSCACRVCGFYLVLVGGYGGLPVGWGLVYWWCGFGLD